MSKDSFLFVPYHAGNPDLAAHKLANSDARSHAAAVSRQRRETRRLKTRFGVENSNDPTPAIHGIAAKLSTEAVRPEDYDHGSVHDLMQDDTLSAGKSGSCMQHRQEMRAMQFTWRAGNLTADLQISGGLRIDPFGFTPSDDFARSAIDYFTQVISPINQPIYAIFNVTNIYTSYWLELMQHEDYRPVGIAMVGAIMSACNPASRMSKEVKSNQTLALSRLQKRHKEAQRAEEPVHDDVSIITVLGLANLARFLGDNRSYDVHRSNVKSMVLSRGGMHALGHQGLAAASVSQWDSFWTIQEDGIPLFPESRLEHRLVYPAFPLSPDLRDVFMKLPVGFQSLVLKGMISVELMDVLGRTAEAVVHGVEALSPGNMWHSQKRRYRDFLEACPTLAIPDASKTMIEKYLTLALFLYCANAFTHARSSSSLFGASRIELTRLLLRENHSSWLQLEKECLYWMCVVCIDAWRQHETKLRLLPKGQSLIPLLKHIKKDIGTHDVLQRFFYNQELLNGYLRIYPIKSCRGFSVKSSTLGRKGLKFDRCCMFVDDKQVFITIRNKPEMTLIKTGISEDESGRANLTVIFPAVVEVGGVGEESKVDYDRATTISVPLEADEEWLSNNAKLVETEIWEYHTDAYAFTAPEITDAVTKYFTSWDKDAKVQLVMKGPTPRQFATEVSLNELNTRLKEQQGTEITIERFRPNIIVDSDNLKPWEEDEWKTLRVNPPKSLVGSLSALTGINSQSIDIDVAARCARCQVPNVDPDTAVKNKKEPWNTLVSYRRVDEGVKYKPCFGMLCCPRSEGYIEVGMEIEIREVMQAAGGTGEHHYVKGF
ncbi:hypothetical protein LTR51_000160 [Lithohypha guttulata]|nr:hypothetical protein LTR51_000160 [Lithohypha guttulata]